MPGHPV
jgi:hypothetical protein